MLYLWDLAGGPRAEATWKFKVIPLARGPLATSKQLAGNPENRKTEIRIPQPYKKTRSATPAW